MIRALAIAPETRDQLVAEIEGAVADFLTLERELGDRPDPRLSPARRAAERLQAILPHLTNATPIELED